MSRKTKLIIAVCLIAQSFTSLVLSFVYAGKKKELSKAFLGLGVVGGLGGAYLLYNEYKAAQNDRFELEDDDCWCEDGCDCCDEDFLDEASADDINFTISEEAEPAADAE